MRHIAKFRLHKWLGMMLNAIGKDKRNGKKWVKR